MALTRDQLHLVLSVVIPNMEDGFEIKTRGGEILIVNPDWECCQTFMSALKDEMQTQLGNKPMRVYGYN